MEVAEWIIGQRFNKDLFYFYVLFMFMYQLPLIAKAMYFKNYYLMTGFV